MLGLGPGPHLPIPAALLVGWGASSEPINVQHPTPGIAPNFEAHNTLLELFVQGGLLAVASFLAVSRQARLRAFRARRHILTRRCSEYCSSQLPRHLSSSGGLVHDRLGPAHRSHRGGRACR